MLLFYLCYSKTIKKYVINSDINNNDKGNVNYNTHEKAYTYLHLQ
jgi:hypothetical protein